VNNSIGIGDLVALVTAAGIMVYVLGLVGLAISIRLRFTTDLPTAWYAVSLLPRTIVVGQGVRIWLGLPIILTAIVLPLTFMAGTFGGRSYLLVGILLVVAFVDIFIRYPAQVARTWGEPFLKTLVTLSAGTLVLALGAVIMTLAASVIIQEATLTDLPFFLPAIADAIGDNRVIGILLLFVGSFIVGLPMAARAIPPLPWVKISKNPPGDALEEGRLVTHSDGFWHLFDKNNDLLSIPDERVSEIRIVKKEPPKTLRLLWHILRGRVKRG
jgi:hypothetical protein